LTASSVIINGFIIDLEEKKEMRIEKTVLLIDDDPDDLELLQEALQAIDKGHNLLEARDGEDGLKKLEELKGNNELPCLIVLDLNMPKMDGRQTFLAIKSDEKLSEIPVVIFSTSTSELDRMFFEKYNTAYFVKPVNFQALASTASRMIKMCRHKN
jgi:CheY-like chemotaxis protein